MAIPTVSPGGMIAADTTNAILGVVNVTASTANDAVAASGWTVNSLRTWITDGWMQFSVNVTRTGAAITVPADGNITNTTVATLAARCRGSVAVAQGVFSGDNRPAHGFYLPSTGVLTLAAVAGSTNIATSEVLTLGGFVVLNT